MAGATVGETGEEKIPISGILENIKEAEAKSRNIIKEAEVQKEKTIAEAKRDAIAIRERYAKEIEAALDLMMRETTAKIEIDRKKVFESAEARATKVRSQANSQMEQAREFLIKDFMRAIDDKA